MKFRLVLKTKTKNGHDLIIKFNVPPSKHHGLINFLKIATDENNPYRDVTFTIEKIGPDKKRVESTVYGEFRFKRKSSDGDEKS